MTTPEVPRNRPWFAVKSHGYGAGLPIAWQGWVCLGLFMAITFGLPLLIDPRIAVTIICFLAVGLTWLAERKSDGPWRWRWGDRN